LQTTTWRKGSDSSKIVAREALRSTLPGNPQFYPSVTLPRDLSSRFTITIYKF
jgi:hypothetical protein